MDTIKVNCIAQEKWFIRKQRCQCSGQFDKELMHALTAGPNGPVDRISMQCSSCGAVKEFAFDISTCAPHLEPGWQSKLEAYSRVMPKNEAAQLVMVPMMDRVLGFIEQLQTSGDTIALEFISDAIKRSQKQPERAGGSLAS